jgi:hypothetical protein
MSPLQTSAAIALACLLGACRAATEPVVRPPSAEVRVAPTQALVAGQRLHLDAYVWRDFMPSSPPDGRPLIVVARVRPDSGASVGAAVTADSLWVIADGQAWAARATEEQPRAATGAGFEVVARNGPKWEPGTRVDVVVRLRDGAGQAVYVRAADQLIQRTE